MPNAGSETDPRNGRQPTGPSRSRRGWSRGCVVYLGGLYGLWRRPATLHLGCHRLGVEAVVDRGAERAMAGATDRTGHCSPPPRSAARTDRANRLQEAAAGLQAQGCDAWRRISRCVWCDTVESSYGRGPHLGSRGQDARLCRIVMPNPQTASGNGTGQASIGQGTRPFTALFSGWLSTGRLPMLYSTESGSRFGGRRAGASPHRLI